MSNSQQKDPLKSQINASHTIHVRDIYLHLVDFYGFHVGKYTSPMDGMGIEIF